MKFIVTAETTASYKPVSDLTFPIIQEYCDRHGYEFRPTEVVSPERDSIWERVRSLQRALPDCDWAVHIDADCLITNMHIPLEEFIDNDKWIAISCIPYQGKSMFNDGFCMFRSYALELLDQWWALGPSPSNGIHCLQDRMWRDYNYAGIDELFSIQPQKRFNSVIWSEYGEHERLQGNWTPGDYILHCPGMTTQRRVELVTEYREKIIR